MKREEKRSSSLRRNKSFESKGPPPPPPPPPPTPNQTAPRRIKNKLYICGLLPTVMREELIKIFAEYGKLQEVWVAKKPPGFAFVEYINPRDAEKVVHELDGTKMLGSKVRIEFAKAAKAPDEIRKPKKFPSGMFPTPAKKPLLSSAPIKIPLLGPPAFPPAMRPSSPPLNLPRRMEGEMGMRRVRRNSGGEMSMRRGSPPPYFEPRGSRSPIQRRRFFVNSFQFFTHHHHHHLLFITYSFNFIITFFIIIIKIIINKEVRKIKLKLKRISIILTLTTFTSRLSSCSLSPPSSFPHFSPLTLSSSPRNPYVSPYPSSLNSSTTNLIKNIINYYYYIYYLSELFGYY